MMNEGLGIIVKRFRVGSVPKHGIGDGCGDGGTRDDPVQMDVRGVDPTLRGIDSVLIVWF